MTTSLDPAFLTHDATTTCYLESRPAFRPPGPTLLLVHDGWFGADARTLWGRLIPELAAEFRVLAPDMLGFGRTDKAVYFDRSMYTYRAAHLGSFVRASCSPAERVHAVGTSMGGSILLRDAVTTRPAIPTHSIVSISGSGGPWRSAFGTRELANYSGTVDDIARVLAHMADPFDGYHEIVEARQANTGVRGHVQCLLAGSIKHPAPAAAPSPDPWPERLREVPVPVTVVAGRRDPLLDSGWERHLEGISPLLTTRTVDTRHAPSLDHPELVASLIREHVRRADELVSAQGTGGAAGSSRG
jgi:pimeloyl-ACP methyl ester carboxylesterase